MTVSEITTIVSVSGAILTSVLTVMLQFWTARSNARSAERIALMELYQPRLCDALADFSVAYSRLHRMDATAYELEDEPTMDNRVAAYRDFISAGYRVIALVPDSYLHQETTALMDELSEKFFTAHSETDEMFRTIVELAAPYISATKPTRSRKRKQSTRNKPSRGGR